MKTLVINTRIAVIAIATLFTLGLTLPAAAGENIPAPVELRYLGKINNQPVFELVLDNSEENKYTVIIRDEFNNVLYKDNVKGKNITKRFVLNTEELGDLEIKFEITNSKTDKTIVYEVNRKARMIEDVVVNKIK